MRYAIAGCGNQGAGLAAQLAAEKDTQSIFLLDYDPIRAEAVAARIDALAKKCGQGIEVKVAGMDASNTALVAQLVKGYDILLNATMPEFNVSLMKACLASSLNYIDLYAVPDDTPEVEEALTIRGQLALNHEFEAAGLLAIPCLGVNPGWVDIVVAYELAAFEQVDSVTVRDIEWIDSDDLLVTGPPDLLIELFMGPPGAMRTEFGKPVAVDLVRDEEQYNFPAPIGRQAILSINNNRIAAMIPDLGVQPIPLVQERFAVLSGGLGMKDILFSAIARQMSKHTASDNLFKLFGAGLATTTDMDFSAAKADGTIRNAAWCTSVAVTGIRCGERAISTTECLATMDETLARIPWAPPGVLATTALPVQIALAISRNQLAEVGVRTVTKVADAKMIADRMPACGVQILRRLEPYHRGRPCRHRDHLSAGMDKAKMSGFNQPISGNDMARFSGPNTFMRLLQAAKPDGLDVAVLGVPLDIGASWRSGARFGPKQIRSESAMIRPYNMATGAAPFDSLQIADIGDLPINTFSLTDSLRIIRECYGAILAHGAIPVAMGGDHSITLPILRAIAAKHGPVALVHVDAHADVNDEMFGMRETHGTVFRRAYEEGLIVSGKTWQIGLRGSGYATEDFTEAQGWGFQHVPAWDLWHRSLTPLGEEIREEIGDTPVYISFDIDGLDPAYAPGTGTPEIGGLTTPQALQLIRALAGLDIVGCDLVEVSPSYDLSGNTALTAANLLYELICVLPGVARR